MKHEDRRSTGWVHAIGRRSKAALRQARQRAAGVEPEHGADVYLREWLSWRAKQRSREELARPRLARPAWFDPERDNAVSRLMAGR